MLLSIVLQSAALPPPDLQLVARVRARDVRIERKGEARLEVTGSQGSLVQVDSPKAGGRSRLRNVEVTVRAEARVADPQEHETDPESQR
jgi:hypothetical protein